ncbi:hypothetical protein AMECASPLE_034122 [Ameca splendens]|uniref:Uncharacterized protein n=1 Tax=Ameca splendens TaxID=208324 RepID=A0ABV0XW38_9TELE
MKKSLKNRSTFARTGELLASPPVEQCWAVLWRCPTRCLLLNAELNLLLHLKGGTRFYCSLNKEDTIIFGLTGLVVVFNVSDNVNLFAIKLLFNRIVLLASR